MKYIVKIIKIEKVTWNVKRFVIEKPKDYKFEPGQAAYVSINKPGWKGEERPFTFTCLNSDDFLEFTIKTYPEHKGVTNELHKLKENDELIIREPAGYINYRGKGIFIAGGAGITPFLAILKQLYRDGKLKGNILFFSNKTDKDIILKEELKKMLNKDAVFIITHDSKSKYLGRINEDFLKENIDSTDQFFYVCGPDSMVEEVKESLIRIGIDKKRIIHEKL